MPDQKWRDFGVRAASALVLAPIALAAIWYGGLAWLACVALIIAGLAYEWGRLAHRRPVMLVLGLIYIGVACESLLALRGGPAGFSRVLFLMLVVWAEDIGAYLFGRLVGGPRMAPKISPGKTWSGAAGGTLCSVCAGLALTQGDMITAAWLALLLSIVAQIGDLLESAMKRHVGAKDSGSLIPGHGGLLDRMDGVLAAAPAAFLLASLGIGF